MKPHYDSLFEIKNLMPAEHLFRLDLVENDEGKVAAVVTQPVVALAVVTDRLFEDEGEETYAMDWIAPLIADDLNGLPSNGDLDYLRKKLQHGQITVVSAPDLGRASACAYRQKVVEADDGTHTIENRDYEIRYLGGDPFEEAEEDPFT